MKKKAKGRRTPGFPGWTELTPVSYQEKIDDLEKRRAGLKAQCAVYRRKIRLLEKQVDEVMYFHQRADEIALETAKYRERTFRTIDVDVAGEKYRWTATCEKLEQV